MSVKTTRIPLSQMANMADGGWYLREHRKAAGLTIQALAERVGMSFSYLSDIEVGKRRHNSELVKKIAAALGVEPIDLMRPPGSGPSERMVPIIGRVGADPEGRIIFSEGDATGDQAPIPPGGNADTVALEVVGHSMRGIVEDGSLIYFEIQKTPPTPDMLGFPTVVETESGLVLLKRLLKGSRPGLYDLESTNAPTMEDQRLKWAAEITAIIPPNQARRVILRRGEAA